MTNDFDCGGMSPEYMHLVAEKMATDFDESTHDLNHTPFHDHEVKRKGAPTLLGLHLKNPIKSLGEAYGKLDQRNQQKLMYGLQGTAALCLLTGGVVILATGGPALIGSGLVGTGGFNGGRAALQYVARSRTTSETGGSRVEKFNSIAAGGTNSLQAFSGSLAGMSAVLAYAIRSMKYALEEDDQGIPIEPKAAPEFDEHPVENTKSQLLGKVKMAAGKIDKAIQKPLVATGRFIQKHGGDKGQALLDKGPGVTMIGRGIMQIVEGGAMGLALGSSVGVPLVTAGTIYIVAATVMKKSDVNNNDTVSVGNEDTGPKGMV